MQLLSIFDEALVGIQLFVVTQLYKVAANVFKIFMILAQSDFLEQIDYGTLLSNFYVIIGLVMLFIMAFALLRGIINPDDQKQGTTVIKNIIINFVISCVLLGFLPTIFPFMFDLQDSVLRYNVIGGFFGYGRPGTKLEDFENVNEVEASSYRMVNGIFTAFFNVSTSYCNNVETDSDNRYEKLITCQKALHASDTLKINGHVVTDTDGDNDSFYLYNKHVDGTADFGVYANFIAAAADNNIDFGFFMSLVAGVMLIYVGISYCFDMALRLIKLIFYQAIAPIPIFLRIVPNSKFSGTFNQWLKVTLTCWMEVFVRIFIFSFCMWLCRAMQSTDFMSTEVYNYGFFTGALTQAFILMAIIMFMKRSPKLLSEVTGIDSGNMKLGIREKLAEGGGFVAGAAVGGLATAGIREGVGAVRRTRKAYREAEEAGATRRQKAGIIARGIGGGILSIGNSSTRGFFGGGKNAWGKKTFGDVGAAIDKAGTDAVSKVEEGRRYRADYGMSGWLARPFVEVGRKVGDYFNTGGVDNQRRSMLNFAQQGTQNAVDSMEGWKSKKYAQDTKAQIDALKRETAEYDRKSEELNKLRSKIQEARTNGGVVDINDVRKERALTSSVNQMKNQLGSKLQERDKLEKELLNYEITENMKATHDIAQKVSAASKNISVMHDPEVISNWRSNILHEFGAELGSNGQVLINNQDVSSTGTGKIISALLNGHDIDASWIDENNVHALHEAMDKANNANRDSIADFEKSSYRPPRSSGGSQSGGKGNS